MALNLYANSEDSDKLSQVHGLSRTFTCHPAQYTGWEEAPDRELEISVQWMTEYAYLFQIEIYVKHPFCKCWWPNKAISRIVNFQRTMVLLTVLIKKKSHFISRQLIKKYFETINYTLCQFVNITCYPRQNPVMVTLAHFLYYGKTI